ncbi:hypothetical protein GALMADRAFT_212570 [Galerina marginata CBS 339.88]|uniref:Uncharacterized protein n=1 Tax=Galerina marginata (strain CBS 339.88) TaxID=685588 RepID=A0A067SS34_GALM3|nr:hypothetical protein GALMADRAFT_212570 [Galerina marginata CBS 339.88]
MGVRCNHIHAKPLSPHTTLRAQNSLGKWKTQITPRSEGHLLQYQEQGRRQLFLQHEEGRTSQFKRFVRFRKSAWLYTVKNKRMAEHARMDATHPRNPRSQKRTPWEDACASEAHLRVRRGRGRGKTLVSKTKRRRSADPAAHNITEQKEVMDAGRRGLAHRRCETPALFFFQRENGRSDPDTGSWLAYVLLIADDQDGIHQHHQQLREKGSQRHRTNWVEDAGWAPNQIGVDGLDKIEWEARDPASWKAC